MQAPSLSLLTLSVLPALVLAGPERSYCGGQGALPTKDDCMAAINKINDGESYTGSHTFDAGDCTVEYKALMLATTPPPIQGSVLKAQALDIVTDGCQGSGWDQDSGGNVTVHKCFVCMFGTCAVCNAPRTRDVAPQPVVLPDSEYVSQRSAQGVEPLPAKGDLIRRHVGSHTTKSMLAARQKPEAGVECRSSLGPVKISDCQGLADSLRGKTLALPYIGGNEDCDLAIFAHFQGLAANGDTVADRINHVSDLCKSSGDPVLGEMIDTSQEIPLFGYTIWSGNLCGQFSFWHGQLRAIEGRLGGSQEKKGGETM
ncbi:hypothetical protein B0H66DRAFT_637442 [Apodospora peruviana]|uniref:Ecp2 effector protein domain-containing protein n=1 Tax=Apodospora peruviana TaxID=516989 RepID=A0AAE0IJ81_9PEZI|nr:hypothetical protein B0H66DRAFT_637442 [Apodospora peruviana]